MAQNSIGALTRNRSCSICLQGEAGLVQLWWSLEDLANKAAEREEFDFWDFRENHPFMFGRISLYRFMGAHAAQKSIASKSFKIGRLRDFNDPFEMRPWLTGYADSGGEVAEDFLERYLDHLHNMHGILCFSASMSQPVLWSHYGDEHRGVAFQVEFQNDPERIVKMEYSDLRPAVDVGRVSDEGYLRAQLKQLIFRKSTGWAYENEYRVVARLCDCTKIGGLYFRPIEEKSEHTILKRVVLGFKCPLREVDIMKALDANGFSGATVGRAKMARQSYDIIS